MYRRARGQETFRTLSTWVCVINWRPGVRQFELSVKSRGRPPEGLEHIQFEPAAPRDQLKPDRSGREWFGYGHTISQKAGHAGWAGNLVQGWPAWRGWSGWPAWPALASLASLASVACLASLVNLAWLTRLASLAKLPGERLGIEPTSWSFSLDGKSFPGCSSGRHMWSVV